MNKKLYPHFWMSLILLLLGTLGLSAQKTITGTVTNDDQEGLIGATVVLQNQNTGTITAADGTYSIQATEGDVLVFSFIGMVAQERTVGASSTIDIVLSEDATTLSDVVVSATRQPVRKLETTTAISIISPKLLEAVKPEGFSEAVQGTPGMYTSQSQGRFRGAIFTRGFPDGSGNGLVYTGILIDGIPSLATPARPPDFAFGMDLNVERIEVVRGSAATLFGRASAAGVVNVISRVGGEEMSGTVRLTNYTQNVESRSGFDYKVEGNINGAFTKNLRYNVGGYVFDDRGFRDLGYNDRGGQIRANFDYLLGKNGSKGSVRLFGGYTNLSIQNMIDIPYRLSDNTPREGWTIYDSYHSSALDNYSHPFLNNALGIPEGHIQITDRDGVAQNRSIQAANEDGNYARGFNVGLNFEVGATDWLIVSNKLRYQSYDHGTKFNLGVSDFYFNDPNNYAMADPLNFRILIDGDGNDSDIIDELRFTIPFEAGNSKHNISLGTYYSRGTYTPETYSWFHLVNAVPDDQTFGFFGNLLDPEGNTIFIPPDSSTISVPTIMGASPVPFGSAARRDEYVINVNSFFLGDEMKIADKTTINVGVRYDRVMMDIQGFYNDPTDPDSPEDIQREEEHSDFSFSLGGNYLLNQRSSVYANFVRAFRMPDYGAYTPADPESLEENPRIEDNEIIFNGEIGYRTGFSDVGLDAALFYTNIQNRLATVYEGAIAVQRPLGTNRIVGGELALTYTPQAVKGLLVRTSFTYQNATFQDFKIPVEDSDPSLNAFGNTYISEGMDENGEEVFSLDLKGNQIPRVPAIIFNLMVNYDSEYFGANAAMNLFARRFADATNLYQQDNITNLNLGIYGRYPLSNGSDIKLNLLVKNTLNTDKALRFLYVADNDAALAKAQEIENDPDLTEADTFFTGIPFLPRRVLISLTYSF